ncbi:MAG: hypothetical protein MJA27_26405 [Pseudanabaenales cyanobacterium]|nr:hypothetical protein [Pseudanabaenales cyanobacterium]
MGFALLTRLRIFRDFRSSVSQSGLDLYDPSPENLRAVHPGIQQRPLWEVTYGVNYNF